MSLNSWRQFNFFDWQPIRDPSSPHDGLLYADPNLTAICQGRSNQTAFMATSDGMVKEFSGGMQLEKSFAAYENDQTITQLQFLHGTSLLLTVAEKQGEPLTLHLWDMDKDSNDQKPHCHTTVNITNGANTFPLSAFSISNDYSVLGFGYADGTVIIARGDIIHDRGSRQRVVYTSTSPITGLEFHEDPEDKVATLYVSTISQILTVPTHGRNSGKAEAVLEKSKGCAVGCMVLDSESQQLIVARDEEITYYSQKLRGESFVFDVPKKSIFSYKQYLMIATMGSNGGNLLSSLIESATTRVVIIDTVNKYIAFSGQIANGVRDVFVQWGRINIVGMDGVLYAVKEKDLEVRLNVLKQRHLYKLALQVATSLEADSSVLKQIELEHGDFLYSEGELTDAMNHYIEAIGSGQTSQVILKYRESQHIENLTRYLEALHSRGLAAKEHTTLLLNSYAKMKDAEKLAQFIENGSANGKLDFETAIKICRQSRYYSLATYLAQKIDDPDLAVIILLRDLKDYKQCLSYIQCLGFNAALNILIQHSRILLDEYPMETTALLINLFTGKFIPQPLNLTLPRTASAAEGSILPPQNGGSNSIAAPVLNSYRAFVDYMSSGLNGLVINGNGNISNSDHNRSSEVTMETPTYQPPRPRLIFSSFIDHPSEFVIFLEACLECYDEFERDERNKVDLAGTLFEMYLNLANRAQSVNEKKQWQVRAKELALNSNIDRNTLLLLSHMASYEDGELLAKSQQEGYQIDQFRARAATGNIEGALQILHKYGDSEKELYPLALTLFTSSEQVLEKVGSDEFNAVLDRIKRDKLMAPLQVIQTLSSNSVATVGNVRQYLIDLISAERNEIENNQKLAESYRAETETKRTEIDQLLHDPMVVQYTTCSSCGNPLDLPAVHFACKHSYHQRCLINTDSDSPSCPQCQSNYQEIRAVRQAQEDLAERNDLFHSALRDSDQKFKVVTDFFGRGALSNT